MVSLRERFSYGVPLGPDMVAFHLVMSWVGKAEMPGVGEVMRVMSSL